MDDKKDLKNKKDTEIPTIVLDIKHTCGTYEANIGFFIIAFGIPGICYKSRYYYTSQSS